jgi:hypothetical protein
MAARVRRGKSPRLSQLPLNRLTIRLRVFISPFVVTETRRFIIGLAVEMFLRQKAEYAHVYLFGPSNEFLTFEKGLTHGFPTDYTDWQVFTWHGEPHRGEQIIVT